jgi:arsenite oxidase small subunit
MAAIVPEMTRRTFIVSSVASASVTLLLPELSAFAQPGSIAEVMEYPVKKIARLGELKEGVPIGFTYPLEKQPNFIVKLGETAQGGAGPDRDVVAFSSLCTHMGGNLRGRYRHDLKAIGPCPFHFSTFDLRRGGVAVHASATQSLPQVVLGTEGDDIYAVGMRGLIYGYRHNLRDSPLAAGAVPRKGAQKPRSTVG